ncbi:MAG: lipoyl(octanoyl) transferase LipB [Tidjanibacter sp.]|nr:lipoyl(octanoyl) transferase LipB [Tidjanibacter sp.]MBR4037465.1 lipoyl(octanoyl) transferase LipB [Tidjanibacter sp.]MBR4064251.1 lipoyl(octanoyl) transferase LipB [Tidjanibacter sp.]MBR6813399.1 lipoyl(octanoyl) transferase LipB [Tidjanibacter sp.]MBR7103011.1 lipoyl(octanoyl) transferase LipB [Tidjanibacter sp.]
MEEVLLMDLGQMEYDACRRLQQSLFDELLAAKAEPTGEMPPQRLILVEHPPVYTLGKSGKEANLLVNTDYLESLGATFHQTDRGGDITFHGPGQIVGYPILDLEREGIGLRAYIEAVEQTVIDTLADYGIAAGRSEGAAGVWLAPHRGRPLRKICAIGVRSSRYVTMHGFALNVNTNLDWFELINPCGFTDRGVTSLAKELGREVSIEEVKSRLVAHFAENINVKINIKDYAN